jgi:hypothetical protein
LVTVVGLFGASAAKATTKQTPGSKSVVVMMVSHFFIESVLPQRTANTAYLLALTDITSTSINAREIYGQFDSSFVTFIEYYFGLLSSANNTIATLLGIL